MVVELAILTSKVDASVWREALGYVGLAALLEAIGSSGQGYLRAVRPLIDHNARDHNSPVDFCMRVRWAHESRSSFVSVAGG